MVFDKEKKKNTHYCTVAVKDKKEFEGERGKKFRIEGKGKRKQPTGLG